MTERDYKPNFDTTVKKRVETTYVNTMHTDCIDWDNYPFDDPSHTSCLCTSDEGKRQHVEELIERLRLCERCGELDVDVYASNYGGWPRIWHRVVGVGMGSAWPYWRPRPIVKVVGTLGGIEWYDWTDLTGAEVREKRGES